MNASIAPNRAVLGTLVLLAIALATASPATATIIDSFTDPLPANPLLPVTGAQVLFLGARCDAPTCPPGTIVTNEFYDTMEQLDPPGIPAPFRRVVLATYFEPNPGGAADLAFDGDRLKLVTPGGPMLSVQLTYGSGDHPMNLDLGADGSDRLEIEILAASSTSQFGTQSVLVMLHQDPGQLGAGFAGRSYEISGPGVLVVPYSDLAGLEDFDDDVDMIEVFFTVNQGGWTAASELVVGEIRTAATPTAAEASSWGRIKGAYRR